MSMDAAVARYLSAAPTDEETAHRDVHPYRGLEPIERIEALTALLRSMDRLLAGRAPTRSPDDAQFWRHWMDPSVGRTR